MKYSELHRYLVNTPLYRVETLTDVPLQTYPSGDLAARQGEGPMMEWLSFCLVAMRSLAHRV